VLVDRELARRLRGLPGYRVRPLHRVSVRGYDDLQPWLVRRRPAPGSDDPDGGSSLEDMLDAMADEVLQRGEDEHPEDEQPEDEQPEDEQPEDEHPGEDGIQR
jgi:adenylate cyclase